jgi:murein DD-endopeptidase MepM/ murein hydrolase activator NlpD
MATRFTPDTDYEGPAGEYYDDVFDPEARAKKRPNELKQWENMRDNHPDAVAARENSNDSIKNQEENSPWNDKTTPQDAPQQKGTGIQGFLKTNKKRGPAVAIVTVLIGGIIGLASITPGLLLIHVGETLTNKFNLQDTSLSKRADKVLMSKFNSEATSGFCKGALSIGCKFASVSDRQLEKFKAAGIEVELGEKTLTGRNRINKIRFKGVDIEASELSKALRENPELRIAFRSVYNSKFAGFVDNFAIKTYGKLNISRAATFDSSVKTDAERTETMKNITKNGELTAGGNQYEIVDGKVKDKNGNFIDKEGKIAELDGNGNPIGELMPADSATIETLNAEARNATEDLIENGKKNLLTGKKSGTMALEAAEDTLEHNGSFVGGLKGGLIGALPDAVCSAYAGAKAISFAAKTIRAAQMTIFAYQFLKIASQIKAGDAKPADVAYFATILTTTLTKKVLDDKGNTIKTITTKAATDSYGYKYAAYGDTGPLSLSATQFLAGGGMGGELSGVLTKITSVLGGRKNADRACAVLGNKWTGIGLLATTVAVTIFTGGLGGVAIGAVVGGGLAALGTAGLDVLARNILPAMLQDIVAGVLIDDDTVGEAAGDALVSGTGAFMSTLAGRGGNAPLKPADAVAYTQAQTEVLAQYAEEDRLTHSPFDPSNSNTFMGKIVSQFIPLASQQASLLGYVSTTSSIVTRSLATVFTPSTFAANTVADFELCEDVEYRELGLATDPFCNPIRGIPPTYLDIDPIDVVEDLQSRGYLENVDTQETPTITDKYQKFIKNCIDRESPLGDDGETGNNGDECFIDDQEDANLYLYQIDSRVLDGMENGYALGNGSSTSGLANAGRSSGGAGLAAMFDNKIPSITQEFGPTDFSRGNSMYDYQADYGIPPDQFGHTGVDYGTTLDTKLYSPVAGKVVTAGGTCFFQSEDRLTPNGSCPSGSISNAGTGELKIQLSDGTEVILGHMHQIAVKVGDQVSVGQYVGLSGTANGPHVHLEYRTPDTPNHRTASGLEIVDPRKYL